MFGKAKSYFNKLFSYLFNMRKTYKGRLSFIIHNIRHWSKWNYENEEGIILTDLYPIQENFIIRSYFLNVLAKNQKSKIYAYAKKSLNPKMILGLTYKSFNTSKILKIKPQDKRKINSESEKIFTSLKDKRELLNLKYNDLDIGIDIYETYLRLYSKPTVILDDIDLLQCIKDGISLVHFWMDFVEKNNVKSVVISHDCYLNNNVIAKIAYKYKIPVYMIGNSEMHYLTKEFAIHDVFKEYRNIFKKIPPEEQKKAIELAKNKLDKRLVGDKEVDVRQYNINCAQPYHSNKLDKKVLDDNNKLKVIILSHCFFDNPHSYEKMMFVDFYEWLKFLVKIAEKTDYDWYIKLHPSALPGNEVATKEILKNTNKIKLIPAETPHSQLIEEGISVALTLYGSVGHEYPLLGIDVVTCGYNPRAAYDFNWKAKNIEEYENLLLNLHTLKKDIDVNDVYEFYYMNNYYTYRDDLIFNSYEDMIKKTRKNNSNMNALEYFLENFTLKKHEEIIENIENFIVSRKKDFFINGPE